MPGAAPGRSMRTSHRVRGMSHPPRVRSNSAARAAGDWGQVVPRRRRGRPEEESSKVVHLVDTEEFEDLGLDGSELRCEDHGRAIERLPEDAGFRGRLSQRARPVRWENTMKTDSGSPEFRDAAYLYMLRALPLRDLTTVLGCFPTPEILREASSQERLTRLGVPLSERMGDIITRWDVLAEKARVTIDRSMANGIHALSLLSNTYPELLRLIPHHCRSGHAARPHLSSGEHAAGRANPRRGRGPRLRAGVG